MPEGCGYDFYVGGTLASHVMHPCGSATNDDGSNSDGAQSAHGSYSFVTSCGTISPGGLNLYVRSSATSYCCTIPESAGGSWTLSADGNSATYSTGYYFVSAQYNVSASLDPSYQAATIQVMPSDTSMNCVGADWVNFTLYDGNGNVYNPCQVPWTTATATLGDGNYV
jgi:hypothetical protein